jgi:hypothetical protein
MMGLWSLDLLWSEASMSSQLDPTAAHHPAAHERLLEHIHKHQHTAITHLITKLLLLLCPVANGVSTGTTSWCTWWWSGQVVIHGSAARLHGECQWALSSLWAAVPLKGCPAKLMPEPACDRDTCSWRSLSDCTHVGCSPCSGWRSLATTSISSVHMLHNCKQLATDSSSIKCLLQLWSYSIDRNKVRIRSRSITSNQGPGRNLSQSVQILTSPLLTGYSSNFYLK